MNKIKDLRNQKNMKQSELAKELNIAQNTLSYWEQGKYEPSLDMLIRLADYFGVSVDYLLNGTESGKSDDKQKAYGLNNAYFKIMQDAEESGISPHDVKLAVDFIKEARKRSEDIESGQ